MSTSPLSSAQSSPSASPVSSPRSGASTPTPTDLTAQTAARRGFALEQTDRAPIGDTGCSVSKNGRIKTAGGTEFIIENLRIDGKPADLQAMNIKDVASHLHQFLETSGLLKMLNEGDVEEVQVRGDHTTIKYTASSNKPDKVIQYNSNIQANFESWTKWARTHFKEGPVPRETSSAAPAEPLSAADQKEFDRIKQERLQGMRGALTDADTARLATLNGKITAADNITKLLQIKADDLTQCLGAYTTISNQVTESSEATAHGKRAITEAKKEFLATVYATRTKLDNKLQGLITAGYTREDAGGSGDCFFASAALAIIGNTTTFNARRQAQTRAVREDIVARLRLSTFRLTIEPGFDDFLAAPEFNDFKQWCTTKTKAINYDRYIEYMSQYATSTQDGNWGGDIEIQALKKIYHNRPIIVLHQEGSHTSCNAYNEQRTEEPIIIILEGLHYQAYVKKP
jgi:hypothetical protein